MNTPSPFNYERLKSARLLAGLSLRQVEERLQSRVSYNSISKYEKGQMLPDNVTILKLAEALNVAVGYFFTPNIVELGSIEFRKRGNLTDTEIDLLKEKTKHTLERYIEVESLLSISSNFSNPITHYQVDHPDKVEDVAKIFRQHWCLGNNPVSNVIEMLEENEVKVIEVNASDKFDGLSTIVNKQIPVAVINSSFTIERKRFTAIHELGHLILNIPSFLSNGQKEAICHRFAAAILFPKEEAIKLLGDKRSNIALGELVALKEEYGISAQAIMKRALDLQIITEPSYKRFCVKISGNRKEEGLGSYKGDEKSMRLLKLVLRLVSENVISIEKGAELANLSVEELFATLNNSIDEGVSDFYYANAGSFSMAWDNEEPEYHLEDVKTINPYYAAR